MQSPEKPPVAVIAGPTASGKSALAIALAERENGVVINADASQVYADLRILSARPSAEDEARVPHRLYGVIDGAEACSAARWAALAKQQIAEVHAAGQLPILVGGTGLYLRTLIDGIAPVPDISDAVRGEVRAMPAADLYPALLREDPVVAQRLAPADRQRLARALEVIRSTGRSLSHWQQHLEGGIAASVELRPAVVEIDRAKLYRRCDQRLDTMIAAGALDEAAALDARGLSTALPVMKALGVPPLLAHLAGDMTLAAAADAAKQQTRHYAKRQQTWFRTQAQNWPRMP